MKLIPLNKDTIPMIITGLVTFGFFFGGLFEILDYMIFKFLLFLGYGVVLVYSIIRISQNSDQKNRPEEKPQNDSN